MTIEELMFFKDDECFGCDKRIQSDLIALDGMTGKILFDTQKNKSDFIKQFYKGKVASIWADVRIIKGVGFGDYVQPVIKCYVPHNSWKRSDEE